MPSRIRKREPYRPVKSAPLSADQARHLLEAIGLSPERFGELVGVSGRSVRRWLKADPPARGSDAWVLRYLAGRANGIEDSDVTDLAGKRHRPAGTRNPPAGTAP